VAFSEDWLAEHQAKMARIKAETLQPPVAGLVVPLPDRIEFSLPVLLRITSNARDHWVIALKQRKALAKLMAPYLTPLAGCEPMARARLTITRFTVNPARIDEDNLMISGKACADLLLLPTKTHPNSFGIIVDDKPGQLTRVMRVEKVKQRRLQRTHILIERLQHAEMV
jgi:hypothetical protein